jgi:hypothetical protein
MNQLKGNRLVKNEAKDYDIKKKFKYMKLDKYPSIFKLLSLGQ